MSTMCVAEQFVKDFKIWVEESHFAVIEERGGKRNGSSFNFTDGSELKIVPDMSGGPHTWGFFRPGSNVMAKGVDVPD